MSLALIIPVLNEAATLPELIAALDPLTARGCEVLVVDGGSEDGSRALARAAGLPVLVAPRGRARQMNVGAAATRAEVLLFLHADTLPPPSADRLITDALARTGALWGRFDVRIRGRSPALCLVAALMNLRSRLTGIATGDQALFVTRRAFEAVGGFADQPLMEDVALSKRLRACSRPACLRARVTTSGRRWEREGVWRTVWLMWRLRFAYWRGRSAAELAEEYR